MVKAAGSSEKLVRLYKNTPKDIDINIRGPSDIKISHIRRQQPLIYSTYPVPIYRNLDLFVLRVLSKRQGLKINSVESFGCTVKYPCCYSVHHTLSNPAI